MDFDGLIKDAIKSHHILRVQYGDFRSPPLSLEPHCYGLKAGIPCLLAWDRSYKSDNDWDHGWMWLETSRILTASTEGVMFGRARRGYRHDLRHLDPIYAQI